ncbi:sulfatase-like hydrolase/transferase [Halomonas elongata]|uniref:sulfatase-like hydrolase/transferase n=1 Tax=Halomonas elongata TaxID=2746 RepID=UPI00186B8EB3|nr:sulfatase-like hydrolase/transferase [Halomonas elongata]MBW5800355.1 sulfatase-like hydrolase/transferase [Halomonas elongata]
MIPERSLPDWLREPRWWALLALGLALGHAAVTVTPLPYWMLPPIAAGWLLLARTLHWGAPSRHAPARGWPWSLVPLIFWGVYVYLADSFGIVDLGAVFFHLQAGISEHGGGERTIVAILYTLAMLPVLAAFTWLVRHDHRWRLLERLLALVLLATNPLLYGIGQRGAAIVAEEGAWLEQRYVDPVILEAPSSPPNLLVIYLESLEQTYADRERFGDVYAPLTALGDQGVVFEGVRQVDNTGWTMAGMIASQCGVPLMPAGLLHDSQLEPLERVVPGVSCLGDLLAEQGYSLTYLGGASKRFAGKGRFYEGHGFSRVLGRDDLAPRVENPDDLNSWGLYDDDLYDLTVEEIRRLEKQEGPWGLVNLSLATHPPYGYPPDECRRRQGEFDGTDILYSVECSARMAHDLVKRLAGEGLLKNTLVVIASDHLSMRVSAWEQLTAGPRSNTFMLLGNDLAPRRIKVEASTMDILPTVLEAMGFVIDWHRAGLGVSLLSEEPTLVEQHGLETLNDQLKRETALHERLWQGLDIEGMAPDDTSRAKSPWLSPEAPPAEAAE